MKHYSTVLDLEKISARIYSGEQYVGNGCLIWSDDRKSLYCITANHCTLKDDGDISIWYFCNGKTVTLGVNNKVISDEEKDVAIFDMHISNITTNIPETLSHNINVTSGKYLIVGCTDKLQEEFNVRKASYLTKDGVGHILFNLQDLDSDTINRFDEIIGLSGGGCYKIVGETAFFVGFENKAINHDVDFKTVKCVSIDTINELLIKNHLNPLMKPMPEYIFKRLGIYCSINEVLSTKEFGNMFAQLDINETVEKRIDFFLRYDKQEFSLYFCGVSGIGKTRSVLEACKKLQYEDVIYYKSYSQFLEDMHKWQQYANEYRDTIRIIIDETTVDNWREVNNNFYNYSNHFKLILIGTASKNQHNDDRYCALSPNAKDDVIAVLRTQYPTFLEDELDTIRRLSYTDLRLAILIARLYNDDKDGNKSTDMSILHSPSVTLQDKFSSANHILNKTFQSNRDNVPSGIDINLYFNRLSLFVDIGITRRAAEEISELSKFFGDSDNSNFQRTIDYLTNINLGLIKGDYFELSPRALAKLAFEQQGWQMIKHNLNTFMDSIPTDIMRRRFFDRVDECSMRKEVGEALASWFRQKYNTQSLDLISYSNAHEISTYIEHFPYDGLPWLHSTILNASEEEMDAFGADFYSGRRYVVYVCEHLANFKEYFFCCEEILFRLATHENEKGISNNSQGIWSGLYSIMTANTEVPFDKRYDLLISRMTNDFSDINSELFSKAISIVLSDQTTRWVPPAMIGGVMTPQNWQPSNLEELVDAKKYVLNKINKSFESLNKELQNIIVSELIENINSFMDYLIVNEYKETMTLLISTQWQKNNLIYKIQEWIDYHNEHPNARVQTVINDLELWIDELKDKSLIGRINEFLDRSLWSYGHTDRDKELLNEHTMELCHTLNGEPEKIKIIQNILLEKLYKRETIEYFAKMLAVDDEAYDFVPLIDWIINEDICEDFARGYYSGIFEKQKIIPEKMMLLIDDASKINPMFALWASVVFDVNERGFIRILSLIDNVSDLRLITYMRYEQWYNFLNCELKNKLLTSLRICKNSLRFQICLQLFDGWLSQGNISDELYGLYVELLDDCVNSDAYIDILSVERVIDKFSEENVLKIISILLRKFNFNSVDNINGYIIDILFKVKNDNNESVLMEMLGDRLILSKNEFRAKALTGLFDNFSFDTVKSWIEQDPNERAPLIAYHLLLPDLGHKKISALTEYMFVTYANDEEVYKSAIIGNYNFVVYSPDTYYNNRNEWYDLLKEYESSEHKLIKKWADYKKNEVARICDEYIRDKIADSRYE